MTTPLSLPPSCVLYVDGVRYNDGAIGENPLDPVALDDLKVVWGRSNSLDQPTPTTLTFTVLDAAGGQRFLDKLHIGAKVDVNAEATIYPDPDQSTIPALLPGPSSGFTFTGSPTVSVPLTIPLYGGGVAWVNYPPAAYSSDPSAWDAIPRTLPGQSWRLQVQVIFPGTLCGWRNYAAEVRPVAFVNPSGAGNYGLPDAVTLTPANTDADLTFVPPAGVWLGFTIRFYPTGPSWDDLDGSSWTSLDTRSWEQLGKFNVQAMKLLAPAAGALRAGTVVSGRITDLTAQYDEEKGATLVDVIVQSHLAELGNRYVGDTPWAVEGLAARFGRIVTASGQSIQYTVDSSVANLPVSWRDVDNQPAATLLQELAKSVGGALWSAASIVNGPYLWLEDIDQRPSMSVLQEGTDGIVRIVLRSTIGGHSIQVDACDVLLEPVQWAQTTEDNSTRVVVTWQLQGTDDKGNPKVTATDELAVDTVREVATGRRRIQLTTQLSQQANAAHVANSMLGRVVTPGWRITGLTMDLAHEPLDARLLGNVMAILDGSSRLGLGILLTNLPAWSPVAPGVTQVGLFLEGGRFTNSDGAWTLELLTSSADAQGKADVVWGDLPAPVVKQPTRTNRATNPRADAAGAAGWVTARGFGTGGAGTYSFLTGFGTVPAPGVATARRKTWTTAATNNVSSGFQILATATGYFPVTPGLNYAVSGYVRHTSSGNKLLQPTVMFVDGSNNQVGGLISGTQLNVASGLTWTRLWWMTAAPAGAVGMSVFLDAASGGTAWNVGATMDATALLIEQGITTQGDYFDGATTDVPPIDYAWTGAVNASTSTATDATVADPGWRWQDFAPDIAWNDLAGVSYP